MIHQIMIIANSGICIFNHEFSEMKVNPQLFSGFAIALNSFTHEMTERNQSLESVKMTQLQLIISSFQKFFLVLVVNKYENLQMFDSLIIEIQNLFLEMYGHIPEDDLSYINLFDSFHPVVEKVCNTILNIGIIGGHSEAKTKLWELIIPKGGLKASTEKDGFNRWNVLQHHFERIPNCHISIWNFDLQLNAESMTQLLEESRIIYIIVEPVLNKLLELIPIISAIRKVKNTIAIYGIVLVNYGRVLDHYCEAILNIPVFSLDLATPDAKIKLFNQIESSVIGK